MAGDDSQDPKVLVVDDDPNTRSIVVQMLNGIGPQVVEASHAFEALEIARHQNIGCIITDLIMPRMSGTMMMHVLLEEGIKVPVVLITGFSDKDSAIQALRLGAFDYLEKPFGPEDIRPVVEEALRQSQKNELIKNEMDFDSEEAQQRWLKRSAYALTRMRIFREDSYQVERVIFDMGVQSWPDVFQAYSKECQEQSKKIRTLLSIPEAKTVSECLGHAMRLVQAMRIASNEVGVRHIGYLCWVLERTLGIVKRSPDFVEPEHLTKFTHMLDAVDQAQIHLKEDLWWSYVKKCEELESLFRTYQNDASQAS